MGKAGLDKYVLVSFDNNGTKTTGEKRTNEKDALVMFFKIIVSCPVTYLELQKNGRIIMIWENDDVGRDTKIKESKEKPLQN